MNAYDHQALAASGRTILKRTEARHPPTSGAQMYMLRWAVPNDNPLSKAVAMAAPTETAGFNEQPEIDPIAKAAAVTVKPMARPKYSFSSPLTVATFSTT